MNPPACRDLVGRVTPVRAVLVKSAGVAAAASPDLDLLPVQSDGNVTFALKREHSKRCLD